MTRPSNQLTQSFNRCLLALCIGLSLVGLGCEEKPTLPPEGSSTPVLSNVAELTSEEAGQVLAQVGDRTITLGDFVAALGRMDPFERLRYQTPERRRQLLDEMINVELLAGEAAKAGLGETVEVKATLRQLMRQELQREIRASLPALSEVPTAAVQAYYDAHPEEFADPERRRVSVIASYSVAQAKKLLIQARDASATEWGKLVRGHSVLGAAKTGNPTQARPPLELEGDLGLVSAPGQKRGANALIPEPVRAALFQIEKQGGVYGQVVSYKGKHYVLRLVSTSPARTRSLPEVDNTIRVRLLREQLEAAEADFAAKLRSKFLVHIDQEKLGRLRVSDPPGVEIKAPNGGRPSIP